MAEITPVFCNFQILKVYFFLFFTFVVRFITRKNNFFDEKKVVYIGIANY